MQRQHNPWTLPLKLNPSTLLSLYIWYNQPIQPCYCQVAIIPTTVQHSLQEGPSKGEKEVVSELASSINWCGSQKVSAAQYLQPMQLVHSSHTVLHIYYSLRRQSLLKRFNFYMIAWREFLRTIGYFVRRENKTYQCHVKHPPPPPPQLEVRLLLLNFFYSNQNLELLWKPYTGVKKAKVSTDMAQDKL